MQGGGGVSKHGTDCPLIRYLFAGQTLTPSCNFPSSFERTWFVQYTTSGADTLEIMYDETQNSAIERRIYKSNTERPSLSETNLVVFCFVQKILTELEKNISQTTIIKLFTNQSELSFRPLGCVRY